MVLPSNNSSLKKIENLQTSENLLFNGTSVDDTYWSRNISYVDFDDYGNVQQTIDKQGTITTYIWGYNGEYPVAKVQNATYTDVSTAMSAHTIEINNGSYAPENIYDQLKDVNGKTALVTV